MTALVPVLLTALALQNAPAPIESQLEELLAEAAKAPVTPDPQGKIDVPAIQGSPSDRPLVDRTVVLPPTDVATGTIEFTTASQVTVEVISYSGPLSVLWKPIRGEPIEKVRGDFKPLEFNSSVKTVYAGMRITIPASTGAEKKFQYVVKNPATSPVAGRIVIRASAQGAPALPPIEDKGFVLRDPGGAFEVPVPPGWLTRWTGLVDRPLLMVPRSGLRSNFILSVQAVPRKAEPDWDTFTADHRKTLQARTKNLALERKEPGRCGDHPALLLEFTHDIGRTQVRSVQYAVAAPSALYTLTWTGLANGLDFKATEAVFLRFRATK